MMVANNKYLTYSFKNRKQFLKFVLNSFAVPFVSLNDIFFQNITRSVDLFLESFLEI